jgi:hypothetical protein
MGLCEGVTIPTMSTRTTVTTRSPPESLIEATYAEARMAAVHDPNKLSAVLEVTFGATRIVLGSDLTTAGWHRAVEACPALTDHHGLKVPHHGSSSAHHPRSDGARPKRGVGRGAVQPFPDPVGARGRATVARRAEWVGPRHGCTARPVPSTTPPAIGVAR